MKWKKDDAYELALVQGVGVSVMTKMALKELKDAQPCSLVPSKIKHVLDITKPCYDVP